MESGIQKPRIQLTGFKNQEKKTLVELLLRLDCVFLDSEQYRNCTHLIAKQPCKSEKFLAACAAGKWILTKDYIINSAESGRWLDETTYEWGYKIETGSHYSPQMQSAPKRWREELTCSGATGAFHRWKVVLLVVKGDKRRDSLTRLLEAGKATICSVLSTPKNITHVLTNNSALNQEKAKRLFGAPYYPVRYLGSYLLENEIKSDSGKCLGNHLEPQQEPREMSDMNLREVRNNLIKHMYLQQVLLSKYTQVDQMYEFRKEVKNACSSGRINKVLEELIDDHLFPIAITEFLSGKDLIPPIKFLHSLLEHILQKILEKSSFGGKSGFEMVKSVHCKTQIQDGAAQSILAALEARDYLQGDADPALPVKFLQVMYALLQHDPPWKSTSMLRYYLEVLQCPVCKKGMWPLIEMLVRSCLCCNSICHSVPGSENIIEKRTFHKRLLTFILNLLNAEVLALTRSLCEAVDSPVQQVMPQTVLQKTFWTESESVFFNKQINILVDWVIRSYREKYKKNDLFKCDIADLLNGMLGAVVEYWVLSGFIMDRNMLYPVANDLANYIAVSCDDFSTKELKMFISSIPSLWLEMFVAEAVFKNTSLQSNAIISTELLSLQKIVCSYLPALQEGMRETGKMQKAKKKKIGQWPCPESQRALLMLNGDKQNQAEVLPDVPVQTISKSRVLKKLEDKARAEMLHSKENWHSPTKQTNVCKVNVKGETSLHIACKRNNVKRLIHLLSIPGIDINVKDYTGWTPLHEACNHGSTVCVREILQHCPEVDLFSQVNGLTPLHDALSNGHVEIAKLLLQHGGPPLLQMKDSEGKLPLDYIDCITTKQNLLHVVKPEETVENFHAQVEKHFYNQRAELWTALVCKMLLNFCSVYNLFMPFSITFKNLICSKPLLAIAGSKFNTSSPTHWFIELYCRELKTFQNLPGYLQKTIEEVKKYPGEQMQAFVVTLQQISVAVQMSCLDLSNKLTSTTSANTRRLVETTYHLKMVMGEHQQ